MKLQARHSKWLSAAALLAAIGTAQGAELQGTIEMVDRDGLAVTIIDSGPDFLVHELRLPREAALDTIQEGAVIRATYEDVDGTKLITAFQVL